MEFFKSKQIRVPPRLRAVISNIIDEGKRAFDLPFNNPDLRQLSLLENGIAGGQKMIRTYLEQLLILLMRHESQAQAMGSVSKETMLDNLAEEMVSKLNLTAFTRITVEQFCKDIKYSKAYLS